MLGSVGIVCLDWQYLASLALFGLDCTICFGWHCLGSLTLFGSVDIVWFG